MEKKKIVSTIMFVFAIILFVVGGVLSYNKYFHNNEKEEVNPPKEITEKELIEQMLKKVTMDKHVLLSLKNGKTEDFEDWQKILFAIRNSEIEKSKEASEDNDGYVSNTKVYQMAQKIFGSNIKYIDGYHDKFERYTFNNELDEETLVHNKVTFKNNYYVIKDYFLGHGGGGLKSYDIPYQLIKENSIYRLECYRVYIIETDMAPNPYYSRLYKDIDLSQAVFDMTDTKYDKPLEEFKDIHNYIITYDELSEETKKLGSEGKLTKITYTFEIQGSEYIWIQYEAK